MSAPFIHNIGAYVAAKQGLVPAANGAGTRNGTGIDRFAVNSHSGVLVANIGAAAGAPTSFTYDLKVQHSADNSTWADYTQPDGSSGAIAQQTAAGLVELDVSFQGANQYVRVVEVTAFVGGTSPTLPASVALVLGGTTNPPI